MDAIPHCNRNQLLIDLAASNPLSYGSIESQDGVGLPVILRGLGHHSLVVESDVFLVTRCDLVCPHCYSN